MEKLFRAYVSACYLAVLLAVVFVAHKVDAQAVSGFGTVGIIKIETSQEVVSVLRITPTIMNYSATDQPVMLEVSITDNYDSEMFANADRITSDVLDAALVIPKGAGPFTKTYSYPLPEIARKSTYRIELRLLDTNGRLLYLLQGRPVTLGNAAVSAGRTLNVQSWFEYDGKRFSLQDGPVVTAEKMDTAMYVVEAYNRGSSEEIVTASEYSSRKYASADTTWESAGVPAVSVSVPPGKKAVLRVPARRFDSVGTFEGRINIYAESSGPSAGSQEFIRTDEFRYMLGNTFITVTDATLSTSTLELAISKSIFDSTVLLTEEVLNSTTSEAVIEAQTAKEYSFAVAFRDSAGKDIYVEKFTRRWSELADIGTTPFVVNIGNADRRNITLVQVTVSDAAGMKLFDNSFPITAETVDGTMSLADMVLLATFIIVASLLIAFFPRRRKMWMILLAVVLAAGLFLRFSNVLAITHGGTWGDFSVTDFYDGSSPSSKCSSHGYTGLTMSGVSLPLLPIETDTGTETNYLCGHTYKIRYDPINGICGNTPMTTYFYTDPLQTQGVTVTNNSSGVGVTPNGQPAVITYTRQVNYANPKAYSIKARINDGYQGTAKLTGFYYQVNGICASRTGNVTFTFKNVQCVETCNCVGRNKVCDTSGSIVTTPAAVECSLKASCSVSASADGSTATFTTIPSHAIGTVSYANTGGGSISNPIDRPIPTGGSVTQNTTITDAFDGMTASASCTASSTVTQTSCDNGLCTTDQAAAGILKFRAYPSVVASGTACRFEWETQGMSLCSFKVNNVTIPLSGDTKNVSDLPAGPADGNNKNGTLTCVASSTQAQTLISTTTCRINPEVRQQ